MKEKSQKFRSPIHGKWKKRDCMFYKTEWQRAVSNYAFVSHSLQPGALGIAGEQVSDRKEQGVEKRKARIYYVLSEYSPKILNDIIRKKSIVYIFTKVCETAKIVALNIPLLSCRYFVKTMLRIHVRTMCVPETPRFRVHGSLCILESSNG